MRMTFLLTLALVLLTSASCSTVNKAAAKVRSQGGRELVLEPKFVRATPKEEFFGYRRLNRMSPLVLENVVIQGNAIDSLVAYNRTGGGEIWRIQVSNGVEGGVAHLGDSLYFGSGDGLLRSVKLADGAPNWSVQMRSELLAPPTLESSLLIAQTGADVIYGLETASGKLLWTYNRQVTGNLSVRATSRPVIVGDLVLVGFSDGFLVALRKRDGVMQWERKLGRGNRFRDVDTTPVVDGANAYVASFDGQLVCVKIESGEIVWQSDLGGYLPVTVGTGAFSERLYFATVDGRVVELDRSTGKERRAIKLQRGIATQPMINKNVLIYGESEGALRVVELESFKPLAQYQTGDGILSTPTVDRARNEIWFISSAANLYSLKMGYQRVAERFPWKKHDPSPPSQSF